MAPATPQSDRTPMSRADAARHAALVRWKKEQPLAPQTGGMANPKIAARVKEILAAKQKKGKPKPKGGKGKAKAAKQKDSRTPQEKANQNRASVAKQTGMGDLEGPLVRLNAGMQGAGMENDKHDALIKKGLAKRGADGTVTLSPAGKKWKRAADKGDADGANAALQDGKMAAGAASQKEQQKIERASAKQEKQAERAKKQQAAAQKQKQAQAQRAKMKQAAGKVKAEQAKAKEAATKEKSEKSIKERATNRAKVAAEIASNEAGLSKRGTTALNDFADGKPLDPGTADDFEAMGIVEKDEKGNHRLTTEGRAVASAMSKGDARATLDAISRAASKKTKKDTPKKTTPTKERKALDMPIIELTDDNTEHYTFAIKAGARHSRTDMQHIQAIHDSAVACGAGCATDDEADDMPDDDDEEGVKAIKGIMDNPLYYAQHECGDIMQAANALSTMCMLMQSELAEEDEDDAHISMLCDGARTLVKFISAELDELEGAAGDAADDARMGPMHKADDTDWLHIDGDAIKALDNDTIRGYAVRFGDSDHPDLQKDYYTKTTDFWLDHFGWPRPITYHHGMDAQTRNDPVIGHWLKAGVDDVGVWMEGQMDRAHAYYKAMKELAQRGYLRLSSDSAPQWVIREKQQNGVNEIKRWPLVTSSVTVTPMEPRMLPVEVKAYLAEIGLDIDDSQEAINPDAAKADGQKAADDERTRVLLLELDLLELETA